MWRIFSAAKGSSGFHNQCLDQIVEYYRSVISLAIVWVCTDGCRGQYKGKRNFRRISTFASEHSKASHVPRDPTESYVSSSPDNLNLLVQSVFAAANSAASASATETARSSEFTARSSPITPCRTTRPAPFPPEVRDVILRHLFACGHHFKGPHHGYGKDAKFMPRTAERHQRARIATTFCLYQFNATYLPCPRRNVLASELVAALRPLTPSELAPLPPSEIPADWESMLNWANVAPGETCLPYVSDPAAPAADTNPMPVDMHAAAAAVAVDIEDLELDDLNARVGETAHESDPESEADDAGGDFDFEFDETGARVTRDEQLSDAGSAPAPAAITTATSSVTATLVRPPKAAKLSRKARVITYVSKAAGHEEQEGGEVRVVTQ